MNNEQILMCVVALILGMLLAHMLKSVCGCKVVEGHNGPRRASSVTATAEYALVNKLDNILGYAGPIIARDR